jgi:Trypsin-like peptidase domain/Calcineurin-like phosphoesterase
VTTDRTSQAKQFLSRISGGLESVSVGAESAIERLPQTNIPPVLLDATISASKKLQTGESMSQREQFALEAIIIPDKRPAVDIINGDYTVAHPDWASFNTEPIKANLRRAIPSIGRVELPHHPTLPYGGTGFVVGSDLLMTNRHVAEIFCGGLGLRDLVFLRGREAGIDFLQEKGNTTSTVLSVREVVMIHPYWDMALLRVDGLGSDHPPLTLSLGHPEDMLDQDVAVIGYPAFDPRNNADVQNTVFGGVYYVKRLQPGKLGKRRSIESFGKDVSAITHDSSTLGGNSGSAIVHAATGQVIGLHFAGLYLDANFAVPTSELARDAHVVDAGLNFQAKGQPEPGIWAEWWRNAERTEAAVAPARATASPTPARQIAQPPAPPPAAPPVVSTGSAISFTIPLEISVRLGAVEGVRISAGAEMVARPAEPAPVVTPDDANARARSALAEGPLTFRDHFVSLYQSAVADIAGKIAAENKSGIESLSQDSASELVLAAQAVALMQTGAKVSSQAGAGAPGKESVLEKMSVVDHAATCASLGWQLMQAKVFGDTVTAQRLEGELDAGTCDPRWAQTITEYVKYFGVNGTREHPVYVTPAEAGDRVITIKSGTKIAVIGDWGTGAEPAKRVLRQVKQQNPDILLHLGDIYYSGTEEECKVNFEEIVNGVFDRANTKLPVYTMSGNHDMYCGGVGYYALIKRLNKGFNGPKGDSMVQPASFFCLRAEDSSWQILAMDTGRNDYSPFSVTDAVTFVEAAEQDWLLARVQEFSGKTILFSHHQLFSAFSQIGTRGQNGRLNPINPKLQATYQALKGTGKKIAAWFWGHEHNLCIYQPYAGLERGRCLGHSAIPVFVDDTPYDALAEIDTPPKLVGQTELSKAGQFYSHGFAVLALGSDGNASAEYFEDINGAARKMYTETIA